MNRDPVPKNPTVKNDASVATAEAAPWPHVESDIAKDPKVRYGQMENGMRYIIMPNAEPPERVSLRMHVDAGSLMEADDQQGVAHFLEHMVFNGSKNFTPDELIPKMQRLGISFGAHANAYTSFDETVYMLDLPNLSEDTLHLGFTVMRDFADGALLKTAEIDRERGVILSEKTSRDSVQSRMQKKQFEFLMPDVLLTKRFPIGTEEVISTAPRQRFVDFYSDYYIPSQITFLVVGDIDPKNFEERILANFSSLKNPKKPGLDPKIGSAPTGKGFQVEVFTDEEVSGDGISLLSARAYKSKPDTVANRNDQLPLALANAMLNRRFDILAKQEGAPISGGNAGRFVWTEAIELGYADLTPEEGKWREAIPILEQELRRAVEHGFTGSELAEAKANLNNAYEQELKGASTRKSDGRTGLATQLIDTINSNSVFSHPEEDLRVVTIGLKEVTTEACHQAFQKFWDTEDLSLILTTKVAPENTQEEILSLYTSSKQTPVSPPEEKAVATFAYTNFGPPATIVSDKTVADLGIRQIVFSNKVRLNLKSTDFEKNSIRLRAQFGTGKLTQPKDQPGLDQFASAVLNGGGLGKHSNDELQQILAGRNVSTGFGISDDYFAISGRTTPDDLELELQLMAASFSDQGYREEAVRQYRKAIPEIFTQLDHTLEGAFQHATAWLRGGDGRFAVPTQEQLLAYEVADVKSWLSQELSKSYLEVSLVGDLDPEATIALVAKTLGALPTREDAKPALSQNRSTPFPERPTKKTINYQSKIPRAASVVLWKTIGLTDNIGESRRLNALAQVLDDRMRKKIREELGASYSPSANARLNDAYPDYGFVQAVSLGKPEDAVKVAQLIVKIAADLHKNGVTEDEFERAITPILTDVPKPLRENGYWLDSVMIRSQEEPKRLKWAQGREADYKAITVQELSALAKKYLAPSNAIQLVIAPGSETPAP